MQASSELQSAVTRARKGTISLRTTIPETYVNMLKLKEGDRLDWDHDIVNNEVVIKVTKAKGRR